MQLCPEITIRISRQNTAFCCVVVEFGTLALNGSGAHEPHGSLLLFMSRFRYPSRNKGHSHQLSRHVSITKVIRCPTTISTTEKHPSFEVS